MAIQPFILYALLVCFKSGRLAGLPSVDKPRLLYWME